MILAHAAESHGACNLIPGTEKTFSATLGSTNRPYAAPGERLELALRPCDASPGIEYAHGLAVLSSAGSVKRRQDEAAFAEGREGDSAPGRLPLGQDRFRNIRWNSIEPGTITGPSRMSIGRTWSENHARSFSTSEGKNTWK